MKRSTSCDRFDVSHASVSASSYFFRLIAPPTQQLWWLPALFLSAVFILTGCVSSGGGSRAESVLRQPDGPAMNLASGLYERGQSLTTLAARGGATYTSGNKRHYFKFEIAAMKPDRVLLTAFDPVGRPAFRLATDGLNMTGVMYGSNQYVSGPATAENFSRFIPLGIEPDQLVALMTGAQVRPAAAGATELGGSTELLVVPYGAEDDGRSLWRIKVAGGVNQDPFSAVVESAAFGPARRPEIAIRYGAVKNVSREDLGGRQEPFPHSVEVQWTESGQKALRVTYEEVRLGVPVGGDLFSLSRPNNFELVNLN
ncbi:hypothetical protein C4J81_04390 [Deltaproteobacteria bacterium Smac51]|nr:hypothetical protein C4J81_04390 [Deltaproteobacteria bacterium Smac51]